jgi:hypothetical protein
MKQLLKSSSVIARMGGNNWIGKKTRLGLVGGLSLSLVLAVGVGSARPGSLQQDELCRQLQPCLIQPLEGIATALQDMSSLLGTVATGSRRKITFNNNTGAVVFDIHMEFDQNVTIEDGGDFEEYENDGTSNPDLYDDESDPGIAAGGSLTIIVRGSGNARPKVKKWWWTDKKHKRIGDINMGDPGT